VNFIPTTEEQRLAVDSFRRFLEAEIQPVAEAHRDRYIEPATMREISSAIAPFGLPCGILGEADGGMDLDYTTHGLLFMELARISGDIGITFLINIVGGRMLAELADPSVRARYLPSLVDGTMHMSACISEPAVGSNVAAVATRARRDGDEYVINGEKTWISNGDYSDFAVVTARTSDDPRGGLSHILVDRAEHGYEVKNIQKMGLCSTSTAQLFFDDVRVPVVNLLGEEGQGLRNTMALFEFARVHVGMTSVGIAQAALEAAVQYATEREQHGKLIAGHQLVAAMLAEMATDLDASRLLCLRTLALIDAGIRCDVETAMSKWYATEKAVDICGKAIQIHGGNGITKEFPVEKLFRDAKVMPIPDGTTEIQKLIIARKLTGISAF
jgi:alkylation response protein AidB-like acyl-CoA dehydrogenase